MGTSVCVSNNRTDEDIFAVPSRIYPTAVQLLSLQTYREEILTGIVTSAGGLGESLVFFFML